jgi:hypothetical protein
LFHDLKKNSKQTMKQNIYFLNCEFLSQNIENMNENHQMANYDSPPSPPPPSSIGPIRAEQMPPSSSVIG